MSVSTSNLRTCICYFGTWIWDYLLLWVYFLWVHICWYLGMFVRYLRVWTWYLSGVFFSNWGVVHLVFIVSTWYLVRWICYFKVWRLEIKTFAVLEGKWRKILKWQLSEKSKCNRFSLLSVWSILRLKVKQNY